MPHAVQLLSGATIHPAFLLPVEWPTIAVHEFLYDPQQTGKRTALLANLNQILSSGDLHFFSHVILDPRFSEVVTNVVRVLPRGGARVKGEGRLFTGGDEEELVKRQPDPNTTEEVPEAPKINVETVERSVLGSLQKLAACILQVYGRALANRTSREPGSPSVINPDAFSTIISAAPICDANTLVRLVSLIRGIKGQSTRKRFEVLILGPLQAGMISDLSPSLCSGLLLSPPAPHCEPLPNSLPSTPEEATRLMATLDTLCSTLTVCPMALNLADEAMEKRCLWTPIMRLVDSGVEWMGSVEEEGPSAWKSQEGSLSSPQGTSLRALMEFLSIHASTHISLASTCPDTVSLARHTFGANTTLSAISALMNSPSPEVRVRDSIGLVAISCGLMDRIEGQDCLQFPNADSPAAMVISSLYPVSVAFSTYREAVKAAKGSLSVIRPPPTSAECPPEDAEMAVLESRAVVRLVCAIPAATCKAARATLRQVGTIGAAYDLLADRVELLEDHYANSSMLSTVLEDLCVESAAVKETMRYHPEVDDVDVGSPDPASLPSISTPSASGLANATVDPEEWRMEAAERAAGGCVIAVPASARANHPAPAPTVLLTPQDVAVAEEFPELYASVDDEEEEELLFEKPLASGDVYADELDDTWHQFQAGVAAGSGSGEADPTGMSHTSRKSVRSSQKRSSEAKKFSSGKKPAELLGTDGNGRPVYVGGSKSKAGNGPKKTSGKPQGGQKSQKDQKSQKGQKKQQQEGKAATAGDGGKGNATPKNSKKRNKNKKKAANKAKAVTEDGATPAAGTSKRGGRGGRGGKVFGGQGRGKETSSTPTSGSPYPTTTTSS